MAGSGPIATRRNAMEGWCSQLTPSPLQYLQACSLPSRSALHSGQHGRRITRAKWNQSLFVTRHCTRRTSMRVKFVPSTRMSSMCHGNLRSFTSDTTPPRLWIVDVRRPLRRAARPKRTSRNLEHRIGGHENYRLRHDCGRPARAPWRRRKVGSPTLRQSLLLARGSRPWTRATQPRSWNCVRGGPRLQPQRQPSERESNNGLVQSERDRQRNRQHNSTVV